MNNRCLLMLTVVAATMSLHGVVTHRSFRNGYPAGAQSATVQRKANVLANSVKLAEGFSKFRDKAWVTGAGEVTRILEDDLEPPCHQRFILSDKSGHTILIAHNIEECERLSGLSIGDTVAFKGEFISNSQGGLVHWTHPSHSAYKPGGWLKILSRAKFGAEEAAQGVESVPHTEILRESSERKEYFAGRGPMSTRVAAPVNDDWPETGYWLSTNSGARHNKKCENYRKTRGYPCRKNDGRPCGKCGG